MNLYAVVAIYVLFWSFSLFLVLPFGVRTTEESGGDLVPGQTESAPHRFYGKRVIIRTTVVSTILFLIFYLNYIYGWVTPDMLDWTRR